LSLGILIMMASFWPFSRGAVEPPVPTVADSGPVTEAPGTAPPAPDPGAAADAYAAFLASPTATDPLMRLTALRRLADLRLEAAELALLAGDPPDAWLAEAIGLYRALLADPATREFAEWRDHWAYQLARAESMAGRDEVAESVLGSLVAARPDSPLAPEAWFRIGEARFRASDWMAAEQAYLSSLALEPGGPFGEQAHYKLGWSLFKQSLHQQSFEPFATVVAGRLAAAPLDDLDRAGRELVEDSLRAMAIGFAALEGIGSIAAWLDHRATGEPTWAWLAYARLAELYLEQQRWTDAAAAFDAWAEHAPLDGRAPQMQGRAIDALEQGGFSGEAFAAMASFAERFSQRGPWWQGREPATHGTVRDRLKLCLDTLAAHHHAAFQQGAGTAAVAARWYRRWLEEFPAEPEAAERHFLLAELYYGDGQLEHAADAYWSVAYAYGEHPQAVEAGYAVVVTRRDLAGRGTADEAANLSLVEAALAFSDAFSTDARAPAVELEAAERLLHLGRLEAARATAARVLRRENAPPDAWSAALLVSAHAAFDLEDYAAAESDYLAWHVQSAAGGAPGDTMLAAAVEERIAASIYRQAEAAAAAGVLPDAVMHFERIGAAVPQSPVAATAQHDAAALWFNAGEWARAAAAYERFLERWPEHALGDGARLSLAAALVELGDAARAAPALVVVAMLPGEDQQVRRTALWQAAELYEAAGETAAAEATLRRYVEHHPLPADAAMEARHRLALLARQRDDPAERRRWLEALIAADAAAAPAVSARSRTLAAQAALELAMPGVARFEALPLSLPLEHSVPEKAARMRVALDALDAAAAYGVAEVTTEAAFRMAELYRGMATALLGSARPPGLDEDALEQYELLLEEQAFPFEEDAIAIHEANAARARQGLYDTWVIASFETLAELVPARWNRQEMGEHVVELLY
jgi:cellulose synthase operon protein C